MVFFFFILALFLIASMKGALERCFSISNELLAEKSEAVLFSTVSCGSGSCLLAPPPISHVPSGLGSGPLELSWRQAMAWVASDVPGRAANRSIWKRTGATRRRADALGRPGLRGLGLDLGFCAWSTIGRASAGIDAVGAGGEADAAGSAFTVNRGSQVSIIVKTLHYSYVHMQETTVKGRPIDLLVASEVRIADQESNELTYQMTSMHIAGSAILLVEQDILSMFSGTRLCLFDDMHEDVVPVVQVDPPAVYDNTSAVIPQIQRWGLLRLSSVTDIQYLQLFTLLPQVHTADRPSGEPLAGHQLVWSTEALEDYNCGTFGSELSADG